MDLGNINNTKGEQKEAILSLLQVHAFAFAISYDITRNKEDSKDVIQEIFRIFLEKIHNGTFSEIQDLKVYFLRSIRNEALKVVKNKKRIVSFEKGKYDWIEDNQYKEDDLILKLTPYQINVVLGRLKPQRYAKYLRVFYLEDCESCKDFAKKMDFSTEGNARIALKRARDKFRLLYNELFHPDDDPSNNKKSHFNRPKDRDNQSSSDMNKGTNNSDINNFLIDKEKELNDFFAEIKISINDSLYFIVMDGYEAMVKDFDVKGTEDVFENSKNKLKSMFFEKEDYIIDEKINEELKTERGEHAENKEIGCFSIKKINEIEKIPIAFQSFVYKGEINWCLDVVKSFYSYAPEFIGADNVLLELSERLVLGDSKRIIGRKKDLLESIFSYKNKEEIISCRVMLLRKLVGYGSNNTLEGNKYLDSFREPWIRSVNDLDVKIVFKEILLSCVRDYKKIITINNLHLFESDVFLYRKNKKGNEPSVHINPYYNFIVITVALSKDLGMKYHFDLDNNVVKYKNYNNQIVNIEEINCFVNKSNDSCLKNLMLILLIEFGALYGSIIDELNICVNNQKIYKRRTFENHLLELKPT